MAAAASRFCFVTVLIFTCLLFSVILATELSESTVQILNLDGSYLEKDLSKSVYHHLQKRAAVTPSVKKATASTEKKTVIKNLAKTDELAVNKGHELLLPMKNETENTTFPLNVLHTDHVFSTLGTNLANEKYDVSASTTTAIPVPSSPSASSSTTTSTTTTTTTTTTAAPTTASTSTTMTSLPEVLPTRPASVSNATYDHHVYYNSTFHSEEEQAISYWVNFDDLPEDQVIIHRMLSDSHRRAATVTLTFDFPFYGHPLRNITIATGGFIYMGDYMHSWLAATQYIAPLMANFDTSLSNESTVRYFDNGTTFVIEWNQVTLQDEKRGGNFTFQATLFKNGNIVFVYKVIPVSVTEIGDEAHPVKVGLSDAYVIDRIIYFIRRKTIYEYHRINMKSEGIGNNTAIFFTALTTCLGFEDCNACMQSDIGLQCVWCEHAKRCSDGLDRQRQDWLQLRCDEEKEMVNCSALPPSYPNPIVQPLTDTPFRTYTHNTPAYTPDNIESPAPPHMPGKPGQTNDDDGASSSARVAEESSSMGVGSVVAILLILAIVMGGTVWIGYAYRNPHTSSGQLLIRYRPSQWRFRSGEARYTAASVHM